ncbi:MAG: dihydrofolate reductase family protein [Succinivibrio sp.]
MQKVTCLMESSIDGRLDEERWSLLYDEKGEGERDVYYETRDLLKPDVMLFGKKTIEMHHCNRRFHSDTHSRIENPKPFLGIRHCPVFTAVFDPKGTLKYNDNELLGTTLLVILGSETASQEYLDFLQDHEISYTFAGTDGHDLKAALNSLYSDFGLKNALLCGGGVLNGSFLKQALIDEMYLILYPGIDGLSGIKSIFEYSGSKDEKPCDGQSLELLSCEVVRAGVVRLHYRFHFYIKQEKNS